MTIRFLLQLQQRLEVTPENLFFLILRKRLEALDPTTRSGIERDERPVTAEHNALGADGIEQKTQCPFTARDGVVVQALLICARWFGRALTLGQSPPTAVESPHRVT